MLDIRSYDKSTFIEGIELEVNKMRCLSINEVIKDFLGKNDLEEMPFFSFLAKEIDHYGIYIGDYLFQREVDELVALLELLVNKSVIHSFEMGPSYIAAKVHLTQGWWFSLKLADNSSVELFTCYSHGIWKKYSTSTKYQRMSHTALLVIDINQIKLLVDYYKDHKNVSVIAYTENDAIDHTYCHLHNQTTDKVLEIIYHR